MKELAIVGAHDRTRDNAPWDNHDIDIWVFNEWANAEWCKRWDAVIQIHKPEVYQDMSNRKDPAHWIWLQQEHGKPIYMQDVDPDVPDSVAYPLDWINKEFLSTLTFEGKEVKNYRATAAYALPLALYLGYKKIHIYGIEMEHSSEYKSQQSNFAFWVGVATGRQVPVELHCTPGLFNSELYGYEEGTENAKLYEYIDGIKTQLAQNERDGLMYAGALEFANQLLRDAQ